MDPRDLVMALLSSVPFVLAAGFGIAWHFSLREQQRLAAERESERSILGDRLSRVEEAIDAMAAQVERLNRTVEPLNRLAPMDSLPRVGPPGQQVTPT